MQFNQTNQNAGDVVNVGDGCAKMTAQEEFLIGHLGAANDMFLDLPVQHPEDRDDFRYLIHRLQDMVAARPGLRSVGRVNDAHGS